MSRTCERQSIRADLILTQGLNRVVPVTAHAAFDKGAAYLGIKVHTIPVDPETRRVNLRRVRRAM